MAKKKTEITPLARLRVRCVNPPETDDRHSFGLQSKDGSLQPGLRLDDGSLQFECSLEVRREADGRPNFLGAFAHGTPTDRFLYLTLQDEYQIIRRIKVKLASITWSQLGAGGSLQACVDGRGAASVKLLGEGWQAAAAG